MKSQNVYLLAGMRTPIGSLLGSLSTMPAPQLGAIAIKAALAKANISADQVNEVVMGNVIQAGVGQAPARQASLGAGIPDSTPCATVNKVCGSGMQAIIQGAQSIMADGLDVVVAGGMESMSLAPHLLYTRAGIKFGSAEFKDSMQWDGLWDVYSQRTMGNCAEECAAKYSFSREAQDSFAKSSFEKAQKAMKEGAFKNEIIAVTVKQGKNEVSVSEDEGPGKANFEKMGMLKPAFDPKGTITAANASTINDGASSVILGGESLKGKAQFKIRSWGKSAHNPTWFTTAPVVSMQRAVENAGVSFRDIDLFEINEAFAVVPMAAIADLKLDVDKINIHGGAIALGHPIGSSGARIVITLMNAMLKKDAKLGLASLCIGGGEALSLVIERI